MLQKACGCGTTFQVTKYWWCICLRLYTYIFPSLDYMKIINKFKAVKQTVASIFIENGSKSKNEKIRTFTIMMRIFMIFFLFFYHNCKCAGKFSICVFSYKPVRLILVHQFFLLFNNQVRLTSSRPKPLRHLSITDSIHLSLVSLP